MKPARTLDLPDGAPAAVPIVPAANPLQAEFGNIARLAALTCAAPFASLALAGYGDTWCDSAGALPAALIPAHDPFREYTAEAGLFEVSDVASDPRFRDTTCVVGAHAVRSYAGLALRTSRDEVLGTLAVYDASARELAPEQRASLLLLAHLVITQVERRARLAELELLSDARTAPPLYADATLALALVKAESLIQKTFDQAPIGIAYADRRGKFLRCNGTFCSLLGFDAGELVSKSIVDLTHSDDTIFTAAELDRLWAGVVDCIDHERRYVRRNGTVLWVRATTALVRDGNSASDYSVEFLRDITQRKELSAALLQQQTLLEAVITDLPVALIACDVTGNITHFNHAAVELHCVHAESHPVAAQVFLADGVTPVKPDDHPLARALRGETISNLELMIVPPDATPRSTLSSTRRLTGPDGEVLGAVAVIQDTTERKRADLELERVHKQLMTASRQAGMAEVATNVLHNVGNILNSVNISASLVAERIKQSKAPGIARVAALLQEQGPRVGEFITIDEHGKRIPEYLATLGQQLASDKELALQELASLRDNLEHIKETVSMQQTYAKLCGITETVEVAELVEDSLRLNAGAFARHGVTLCREFNAAPKITVDKHKVLQILVNLVRNAKYACDESGKTDKLLTLRIDPAVNGVRISVIDNGVGIAAENMQHLFTHGFTTRQSGHGFGLHSGAIAAQELGGSLHAESEGPGRGAAFILELPCVPREVARG
jgi:PAS domain S-box-containing protein